MKVGIVNYGMGNLGSVRRAVEEIGAESVLGNHRSSLYEHTRVVLPCVGAYAEGMAGRPVPGFKLVDKRPVRKIVDEGPVIDMLRVVGGTDEQIYTTPKLRSPAQLEENFPNLKNWMQAYIEKKSSGKVLVPDSYDREQTAVRTAADDFTPTTEVPDFVTDTQMSDLFA